MTITIDNKSIEHLAKHIQSNLVEKESFRPTRVFLCGGSIFEKTTMRHKIQNFLARRERTHPTQKYEITYPEDIFDELLMSRKYDLLSLESLLANSVDIIMIAVESPGSIAELGAFANDERLIKKTLVINNIKYKKDKSFINQGPIKLLKKQNNLAVMFLDFEYPDFSLLAKSIRSVAKNDENRSNELTLLNLDTFVLPLLYVTGSLDIQTINKTVQTVIINRDFHEQITSSCLTTMIKKKLIEKKNDIYSLSQMGVKKFNDTMLFRNKDKIDEIRLKYLNLLYRGRKLVS